MHSTSGGLGRRVDILFTIVTRAQGASFYIRQNSGAPWSLGQTELPTQANSSWGHRYYVPPNAITPQVENTLIYMKIIWWWVHTCADAELVKSDQCQSALQPHQIYNITQHEELAFHSLLRWKMIILPILTTSLIHFPFKGWESTKTSRATEQLMLLCAWRFCCLKWPQT